MSDTALDQPGRVVPAPVWRPRSGGLFGRRPETSGGRRPLGVLSGLGLGVGVVWFSLLVLLPLAAVVATAAGGGWSQFWQAFTAPTAAESIRLTVACALGVSSINAVLGTVIAWVLVRDEFRGKRLVELLIDIPFALPTIVAGLVLLALYGQNSPIGISLFATKPAIVLALLFVTLPFVVRTVQPVLLALDTEAEAAARSLGAGGWTTFRRIVLPALVPAIASGAALGFGRAMGEYGSVVLISGQQRHTEVSSQYIYSLIQDDDLPAAAATATVLLLISVIVLAVLAFMQSWATRRG